MRSDRERADLREFTTVDLRFDIRRAGSSGISSRVVRFRGSLLAADEGVTVYLTPGSRLVFYANPQRGATAGCWHFSDLKEAAAARREDGGLLFTATLLAKVAASLQDGEAAG